MPIVNKGIFTVNSIYERQVGNDWPSAQVITTSDVIETSSNLYYTDTRVQSHLDVSGYQTAANIIANVSVGIDLSSNTTTDLAEGDNLYYTNARVQSYLDGIGVAGIDLSSNTTTDLAEGDNLYYTNARVLAHLAQSDVEVQDLIVSGNLSVLGNTTTLNATELHIDDPIVHLASNNEVSDAVDFGWLGHYSPDSGSTLQHAGVFRKHNTDNFYIFSQYVDAELDNGNLVTNINTEDGSFKLADIYGNVFYGKISTLENHDTTDLAEGDNLYYTNARVASHVSTLGYISGIDLSGNTTTDLAEGDNLYYTNARVRSAFAEGSGSKLTISQSTGDISVQDVSADFNILINGTAYSNVDSTMSNVLVFPENEDSSVRYILRSLHVTNISENDAHISGNIVFTGDISVPFASKMPIPYGTSLEMLLRPQAFTQLEQIQLQGFDQNESATADLISAVLTYETVYNKSGIGGTGNVVTLANTYVGILDSADSSSIIESIRLINLDSTSVKTRIAIADANDVILSHLSYNMALPSKSSVEILQSPKRINSAEKILAYVEGTQDVSVIISYRGAPATVTEIGTYSSSYSSGGNISLEFNTTIENGTEVFYTIE